MSYAGDVTPEQAWTVLRDEPGCGPRRRAPRAEWSYVGLPTRRDRQGGRPRRVADLPRRRRQRGLHRRARAAGVAKDAPVYFLCRSGVRSVAAAEAATRDGWVAAKTSSRASRVPTTSSGTGRCRAGRSRGCRGSRDERHRPTVASRHPRGAGGLSRSGFEETSEALYLTSGFVYDTAEDAEAPSRVTSTASSTPATATRPSRCSRSGCGRSRAPRRASPRLGHVRRLRRPRALLGQGDRVVSSRALFGSCFVILDEILPRWASRRSSSTAPTRPVA